MSIELKDCKTARELVEELDISQKRWSKSYWSTDWIFRGQANAEWPLLPAALRLEEHANDQMMMARQIGTDLNRIGRIEHFVEETDYYVNFGNSGNFFNLLVQLYAEITNLQDFFGLGESLNLSNSIPMSSEFQRFGSDFAKEYIQNIENDDYMLDLWGKPHIAIAQHHGVATRLLDWTKNPLYAAFFACEGVQDTATHIAIYALHIPYLTDDIRLIEINHNHSMYIHSQEGVFTLDIKADLNFLRYGNWRSLQDASQSILYKFTLPVNEVGELVRILWLKRVTRAHMMPTLDNVIIALKSKWKLQLDSHKKNMSQL